jgi:tetratricopeptide (TPR) repeat protein
VHRQLSLVEKALGPTHPALVRPLFNLGGLELQRANYAKAEKHFSRAHEINVKNFGEHSLPASEALRKIADVYEAQAVYDKAEPYLQRAVKASEVSAGPDNHMTGVALCNFYDRWGKAEKSQPCWHRATVILEKLESMNSPMLKDSLTFEAKALRKLGRDDEAQKLEERIVNIQKAAATQ